METSETKQEEGYLLIPKTWLQDIADKQSRIITLLENIGCYDSANSVGDYITEEEARRQLGRKATWFWNMRTTGQLPFAKVGKKIFYLKSDIKKLLDKSMKEHSPVCRPILSKVA